LRSHLIRRNKQSKETEITVELAGGRETLNTFFRMILPTALWIFLKIGLLSVVVVHTCNYSCSGGRDKRITVQGQPRHKLARRYLKNKPGVMAHICVSIYSGG
jgi:hypothetical protein